MEAIVSWIDELRFTGEGDGPAALTIAGGKEEDRKRDEFSPLNLLLIGLAGCTAADVTSILRKKRQDVTRLAVQATARQAEDHPHVFTHIHLTYRVEGHDVERSAVERSVELSETKYCPAIAMLGQVAPIEHSIEITQAPETDPGS